MIDLDRDVWRVLNPDPDPGRLGRPVRRVLGLAGQGGVVVGLLGGKPVEEKRHFQSKAVCGKASLPPPDLILDIAVTLLVLTISSVVFVIPSLRTVPDPSNQVIWKEEKERRKESI